MRCGRGITMGISTEDQARCFSPSARRAFSANGDQSKWCRMRVLTYPWCPDKKQTDKIVSFCALSILGRAFGGSESAHERDPPDPDRAREPRAGLAAGLGHAERTDRLGHLRRGVRAGPAAAVLRDGGVLPEGVLRRRGAAALQAARAAAPVAPARLP